MQSLRLTHIFLISLIILLFAAGCSSTRHVPKGEYMLDDVTIQVEGDKDISSQELVNYLRQTPNHEVLGFWKLQLGTYNLSGNDTSKWYNRWVRRMGQPPVIYQQSLTDASARQLDLALTNRGYLDATVEVDTVMKPDEKKIDVTYRIVTGNPHKITSIAYDIPDTAVARIIMADSLLFTLKPGDKFDRDNLDSGRGMITQRLRNQGYYAFNKEYITFYADTAENSKDVSLTMTVRPPRRAIGDRMPVDSLASHSKYFINRVFFVTDSRGGTSISDIREEAVDTIQYKDVTILYGKDHYLTPSSLQEKCFITPGELYKSSEVDRTYESLSRLGILKSINIELVPVGIIDGNQWLDAYILLSRNKKQSITFDVEGTNSEGDLGFGLGATYQHRNLAKGSQLLTARLRMNYESLSGSFNGLINDRYTEYAGEIGITFPKFEFPFASQRVKQRLNVSTEFAVSSNIRNARNTPASSPVRHGNTNG